MRSGLVPPRCHVCPVRAAQSASWGRLGPRGGRCARTTACRARRRARAARAPPRAAHEAAAAALSAGRGAAARLRRGAPGRVPCGLPRRDRNVSRLTSKRAAVEWRVSRSLVWSPQTERCDRRRVPLSVTIILNLTVRPAPTNCVPATGTRCAGRSAANPHRTIVCECVANRNDCGVVQNLAVSSSPFTARAGSAHWRLWW